MHKPGLKLGRVEVDINSPLPGAATWLSHILANIANSKHGRFYHALGIDLRIS